MRHKPRPFSAQTRSLMAAVLSRTLRSTRSRPILTLGLHKNPNSLLLAPSTPNSRVSSSSPAQETPTVASPEPTHTPEVSPDPTPTASKPLDLFFKQAVGLIQNAEGIGDSGLDPAPESPATVKKLRDLELKLRNLKSRESTAAGKPESRRLHSLFSRAAERKSDADTVKVGDLLPEMEAFIDRLFEEGYLAGGNFVKDGGLDLNCLSSRFSQDYLKFSAERFGREHQEIGKWLSGSSLKKVASFGCPSLEKNTILAAKRLRSFFSIHEETVCRSCKLKSSCKFPNKSVKKKKVLILADALRVFTVYGLGVVPLPLALTDEMKVCIAKLLNQVVNLSK